MRRCKTCLEMGHYTKTCAVRRRARDRVEQAKRAEMARLMGEVGTCTLCGHAATLTAHTNPERDEFHRPLTYLDSPSGSAFLTMRQ